MNKLSTKEKAVLIGNIISHLKFMAHNENKAFPEGETFFSLAFRSDDELQNIAKLCGC